jgi:fatty-acyl-CoA synthase
MNDENRLFLTGREKDLIIRSGHNIDPAAIEEVANAHPAIAISAAVGMPDGYAGEVPVLFVVRAQGQDLDIQDLQNYMTERIAEPPAKPKKIFELTEMPTTTVGKIFKPRLRELAVQEKIRQEIERKIGQNMIVDLTTESLKNGTTNATVVISSNKEEKYRPEIEAAIKGAFVDLPINIRLKWG